MCQQQTPSSVLRFRTTEGGHPTVASARASGESIMNQRGLFILALVCGGLIGTQLQAQQPERRQARFRESVTLHQDSQVIKTLATAQDHIGQKQWAQAIPVLQQLIEARGDAIVAVEPGRYWNVADYCQLLISNFPPEALAAYRERIDPQVRETFEAGRDQLDEQLLRRVISVGLLSSYGDDALWWLGELAFEQGRTVLARSYWELLLPELNQPGAADAVSDLLTYPGSDFEPADVRARLVLCSLFEGDFVRADRELAAFEKLHAEADGELGGKRDRWRELLNETRQRAAKWRFDRPTSQDVPTIGGDAARNALATENVKPLAVRWSAALPVNRFVAVKPAFGLQGSGKLACFPVVSNGVVYVGSADAVHAFDLQTGQPKWPTVTQHDGLIFSNVAEVPAELDGRRLVGSAISTLTVEGGRLFARLGTPLLRKARAETHAFSQIVGLDVGQRQGELIFDVTSNVLEIDETSPEATSWTFEGTPVVEGNRLFVSARRSVPEDEIHVVCFDTQTSEIVWRRRVCSTLKNAAEHFSLLGHRLLTLADGRVFIETGTGAIAALEAETGKLLWVATYESNQPDEAVGDVGDASHIGLTPCVIQAGLVFAAPQDSNSVFAIEAATGRVLWQQRLTDRVRSLLGVTDQKLVVSGRQLWALDVRTGKPSWPQQKVGSIDPQGFGFGRGVLTQDSVYWPLRDEIWRVDVRTGEVVNRFAIQAATGERGGNLLISSGLLLIAQTDRLVAFGAQAVPQPAAIPQLSATDDKRKPPTVMTKPAVRDLVATMSPQVADATVEAAHDPALRGVSQWPMRRVWTVPQAESVRVLLPSSSLAETQQVVLLQSHHEVRALSGVDGRELWRGALTEPIVWAQSFGSRLVLGHDRGCEARSMTTGKLVWQYGTPLGGRGIGFQPVVLLRNSQVGSLLYGVEAGSQAGSLRHEAAVEFSEKVSGFRAVSDRELVLRTNSRAVVVDVRSGAIVGDSTRAAPANGEQSRPVRRARSATSPSLLAVSGMEAVLAPSMSASPLLMNLQTRRVLGEYPLPTGARQCVLVGESRVLFLGDDHRLTCWSASGSKLWQFPDRISVAHAFPRLLSSGSQVVLIEDGLFARGIDLDAGRTSWSVALGRFPLTLQESELACAAGRLIVISEGVLRGIELTTGAVAFSHYLGPGQWQLAAADSQTICWAAGSNGEPLRVVICDGASGELLQTLAIAATSERARLLMSDQFAVAVTGERLLGLSWR